MQVEVLAFGLIKDYVKTSTVETEAASVGGLLQQLGIPEELVMLATVNGETSPFGHSINAGDKVVLVPPVAGG